MNVPGPRNKIMSKYRGVNVQGCDLQWSEMQCSAFQCSAMLWSAMQCSAFRCSAMQCSAFQCSAMLCSIEQCNAMKCSRGQSKYRDKNFPDSRGWRRKQGLGRSYLGIAGKYIGEKVKIKLKKTSKFCLICYVGIKPTSSSIWLQALVWTICKTSQVYGPCLAQHFEIMLQCPW